MADAWQELAGVQKEMDVRNVTSGDLFGTREYLRNNYPHRIRGAVWGIYGKFQGGSDLSNEAVLQGRQPAQLTLR